MVSVYALACRIVFLSSLETSVINVTNIVMLATCLLKSELTVLMHVHVICFMVLEKHHRVLIAVLIIIIIIFIIIIAASNHIIYVLNTAQEGRNGYPSFFVFVPLGDS